MIKITIKNIHLKSFFKSLWAGAMCPSVPPLGRPMGIISLCCHLKIFDLGEPPTTSLKIVFWVLPMGSLHSLLQNFVKLDVGT